MAPWSMDLLSLVLPVAWAVVATGIGLVLYRSSNMWVKTRSLAVAGSAVIATGCFVGLFCVTPSRLLHGLPAGRIVVDAAALDRAKEALTSAQNDLASAKSDCIDTTRNDERCADAMFKLARDVQVASQALPKSE